MDIVALSIAMVGAVTGVSGFVVSVRADRRAERADKRAAGAEQRAARAEEDGTRARQCELWTELISAMQELVGANVLAQDHAQFLYVFARPCRSSSTGSRATTTDDWTDG